MDWPGWLTLNGFVLLIDLMLLLSVLNKRIRTLQDRTYAQLLVIVCALVVMDSLSRVRTDLVPDFPQWLDQLGTYFIFACDPLGYLFALRYIDSWIAPSAEESALRKATMGICLAYVVLNIAAVTVSQVGGLGWFYSYTADGTYVRGPLFVPRGVANMAFCLVVGLYALLRRHDIRERYSHFILAFPLIVLFSGFLQVAIGGAAFEYAGTVFACLLLYVYVQDRNMNVDYLTGLLNRRGIDRELELLLKSGGKGRDFVVCMVDLDHFKHINDDHGHDAGDDALRHMAELLTRAFGPAYRIGRFGGDEFIIISGRAPGGPSGARALITETEARVERLRHLCEKANASHERPYSVSFSAGLDAFASGGGESVDHIIERVDKLMYRQKLEHHAQGQG